LELLEEIALLFINKSKTERRKNNSSLIKLEELSSRFLKVLNISPIEILCTEILSQKIFCLRTKMPYKQAMQAKVLKLLIMVWRHSNIKKR